MISNCVSVKLGGFVMLVCLVSSASLGCVAPPLEVTGSVDQLIRRSNHISLARLKSRILGKKKLVYSIEVVRDLINRNATDEKYLKMEIDISMFGAKKEEWEEYLEYKKETQTDFNGHKDLRFWNELYSNNEVSKFCTIIPALFKNRDYLIFFDPPYHTKGFELILSSDDRWLNYVEDKLTRR